MNRATKIIGIGCAGILGVVVLLFCALFAFASFGPDTAVYPGLQIPKRFMTTIRSLNLLEENEQIRYFYSDALFDIKEGLYFVTDRNLVLYAKSWEEPMTIIPLREIKTLHVEYNDSFYEDSVVLITTSSGLDLTFPVSSEKGLDRRFVDAIRERMKIEPSATDNPDAP